MSPSFPTRVRSSEELAATPRQGNAGNTADMVMVDAAAMGLPQALSTGRQRRRCRVRRLRGPRSPRGTPLPPPPPEAGEEAAPGPHRPRECALSGPFHLKCPRQHGLPSISHEEQALSSPRLPRPLISTRETISTGDVLTPPGAWEQKLTARSPW